MNRKLFKDLEYIVLIMLLSMYFYVKLIYMQK